MFRKTPKKCCVFLMPDDIAEFVPMDQPDDQGTVRVLRKPELLKDRSANQMNPNIITLQSMIESGTLVEPKLVGNLLNITDANDIEALNGQMSDNMYQYILDHKDEIVKPKTVVNDEN